jgi:hypothetical protein
VLARARAHKNVRKHTYQIMRAYVRLSYHAKTLYVGHIFQSSKRIVVLARARAYKNARASTYQIKCAYVRLSNHAKALVCSEKAPARTYQIMRAYVRDCAQIFPYSESIGVLARTRVL